MKQMAQTSNEQYEAMFLMGPVGAAEPEKSLQMCRGIIERHGGQIILIKKWDERKLAYELGGQKRGTYIISFFRAPGSAVPGIERDVKLSDEILRVLVLKADHLNETEMAAVEPQPIVREEKPAYDPNFGGDRPDRSDRSDRFSRTPRPRREEQPEKPEIPAALAKE
jgi:small subunit ribosomal protein S6